MSAKPVAKTLVWSGKIDGLIYRITATMRGRMEIEQHFLDELGASSWRPMTPVTHTPICIAFEALRDLYNKGIGDWQDSGVEGSALARRRE